MILAMLFLTLRADHVDDLTPAGNNIGKLLGSLFGQRPWCDTDRFAETGNHADIDRVGLGALADGFGEGANLCRFGGRHRQTSRCQCRQGTRGSLGSRGSANLAPPVYELVPADVRYSCKFKRFSQTGSDPRCRYRWL